MFATAQATTLEDILGLARKVLSSRSPLNIEARTAIVNESHIFDELPSAIADTYYSELRSFKYLLEGTHPIFKSSRFLSVAEYNPLDPRLYRIKHRIAGDDKDSNRHGNNYTYTATNLRNGVLFTYYDRKSDSYIPVTFNTHAPICMVVPDPHCIHGNEGEAIGRMLELFRDYSRLYGLMNFPLIVKGVPIEVIESIPDSVDPVIITQDQDISTITAEMNFPAISYDIQRLIQIVNGEIQFNKSERPKLRSVIKRNDDKVNTVDWNFDTAEARRLACNWASSKIVRLRRRGIVDGNESYLINTILQTISTPPPGKQNVDYFALAVRAIQEQGGIETGEVLGIVMASRSSDTVAGLNAVVVPIQSGIRDLGYYSVYKLAEKMSKHGITLSSPHFPQHIDTVI